MRGAFGLVSILVAALIVAILWSNHTSEVAKVNKRVVPQVQQLAGKNTDGTRAIDSVTFAAVERAGVLKGLKVVKIDPSGSLFAYWGLQPNDVIQRIGPYTVGDTVLDSVETTRDWVSEGMQRQMDMGVERAGVTITLPAQRNAPTTPSPASTPPSPSPSPADN